MMASVSQIAPLVGESVPGWSEDTVKGFVTKLPEGDRSPFLTFVDDFARLGARAREVHDEVKAKETSLEDGRAALQADREGLVVERASMDEARSRFDADALKLATERDEVSRLRNELVGAKQELALREAEVRGGLVLEREASLKVLQEQILALERQRDQLPSEVSRRRQELLEEARREAAHVLEAAQEQAASLEQKETELALQDVGLKRRENKIRVEEEVLRTRQRNLQEDARQHAKDLLEEKETEIARHVREIERLRKVVSGQQSELDELDALRQVTGDDPEKLLHDVESLRAHNKELDRKLQEMRSSQSEGDAKELREQRDALQRSLDAAKGELFGLRQQEEQWKLSVMERENAETMRVVLEKHKALLGSAVQELRAQVDDLIDQGKEATAFPELTRMDKELALRIPTVPAPALSALVGDLQARIAHAEEGKQLHFSKEVLQLFVGGLAMSRLHIFQGISGTGKTSLATAFCAAIGATCTVVPVQAGWRDRADLIGHYNAFEKRYYEKDTLQALYRAQTEAQGDMLHVVLLDEMNLSRPEQYFAEFLSAMEVSQAKRLITLMESRPASGAPALLVDGRQIRLPANLWFIGTANHDETTNAFADKTHDRAFVLELPKHGPSAERIARPSDRVTWSFDSLMHLFDEARRKHATHVKKLLSALDSCRLTKILNDSFGLGWGNRLEQQMVRFMPVVLECGGTEALALDHMLATRMFRDGKVTGRHDKRADDLRVVEDALNAFWRDAKLGDTPTSCLTAIEADIQRLERGG
ncbi:AAA domain-containing protein [Ramlibacter sp. G-1-2-2]|uniref:AAA domain-containing protein n=1 Tax=Ramlibacter agri TaxID=2728837 RepID=A0A848HHP4_9BURK|nr:AAA domain-containing protein [Ramlibacter agri]